MRGKENKPSSRRNKHRITPAYAGKRPTLLPPVRSVGDHPRVCGEKHHRRHKRPCKWGSPPRMRGKALPLADVGRCDGITPAYAGKRIEDISLVELGEDHPRVCGEKGLNPVHRCCLLGSPPRMRGKD